MRKLQSMIAAAVVAVNLAVVIHATSLWIYADDDYDKHKTFKRFDFEGVQRCYSIADCFNDRASSASWKNAQGDGIIVFYDEEYCSGKQYGSIRTPNGEMKFADVGLDNMISSFMVWEYGVFATNGIVKWCHEGETLPSGNTTGNATDESVRR